MRAIFLDRDGVINRYPGDKNYITAWKEFRFLPKAKKAIARLHKNKFKIFIVSNQAGVGKGIFSQETLDFITKRMLRAIEAANGQIDGIYYCTHHPDQDCACRKPKAGLIHKIKKEYLVNIKSSFFIGDTIRDVQTARVSGCKSILVLSGKEKSSNKKNWEIEPDFVFSNLYSAAEYILKQK